MAEIIDAGSARMCLRPDYDPELASALAARPPWPMPFDTEGLASMRRDIARVAEDFRKTFEEDYRVDEIKVPVENGETIALFHLYRPGTAPGHPAIFWIHGGGMLVGAPWDNIEDFSCWIDDFDVSVFSVDYRLVPTVTAPVPVEDCYTALCYVAEHAGAFGIDPENIVIAGMSAGGGLAAGTALMARERGGPALRGQLLMAPMLDPDGEGDSVRQEPRTGPWSAEENQRAWSMTLSDQDADITRFNTPGRECDLSALPPAHIEVGSAELFRSENIAYAEGIWRMGGNAELHVWSGGFHGFQSHIHTAVAQGAREARRNWLGRIFGYGPQDRLDT